MTRETRDTFAFWVVIVAGMALLTWFFISIPTPPDGVGTVPGVTR